MKTTTFRGLLSVWLAGLIGGAFAGLVLGLLVYLFSTPLIIQAERLLGENPIAYAGRWPGTIIGSLILGMVLGLAAAFFFDLVAHRIPGNVWKQGLILGILGYWVLAFWPGIIMPANLPGADSHADIGLRQLWWILTQVCAAIAVAIPWSKWQSADNWKRKITWIAIGIIAASLPLVLSPFQSVNNEKISASLVLQFRSFSLISRLVFWIVMGMAVAKLTTQFRESKLISHVSTNGRQNF